MASRSEKDRLVSELKESVESNVRLLQIPTAREDVRRDCAAQILETVVSFILSWDTSDFPSGTVRDAFSVLFAEVGPGDAHVRAKLLETISSVTTSECRQAILDVMPWTMPVEAKELEEATKQVLDALHTVLMDDADALLPVLGCLSLLPLSEKGRAEAWNVALASLPVVSEADLPVLARTLLCHVTSKDDASRALVALRSEFELVQSADTEGDDDPIPLIAHVLLGAFHDRENGPMLARAYLDILRSIPAQQEGAKFLVLDVVAILALYQNPDMQPDMAATLDSWIRSKAFPFEAFHILLKTMCHRHRPGEPASVLYDRLVPSLLSLAIFLLLAPVRIATVEECCPSTHEFIVELHHGIDRDYQEELVRCLFHLSEETSWSPEGASKHVAHQQSHVRSRKVMENSSKRKGLLIAADAVHSLIQDLANTARSSVARFKHILLQRLTSVPTNSAIDDLRSTKQLCSILTCLIEPTVSENGGGSGIDASEVMILLQKLLFTASYCADKRASYGESMGDVGRVVRGLVLATELVQSKSLSTSDKECIHQWVHRILLPSTRRTVDPEIGCHGLQFLSAWSAWHESTAGNGTTGRPTNEEQSTDMFQNVKMVLANTSLVQMLAPYLERRKRADEVVLGYASIPPQFLIHSNLSGKRNKRDMVFCVNSFLRTSTVQHPSRWGQMSKWVYDLVDTYLTMGREGTQSTPSNGVVPKARSKWLPDGWLEASIELPTLNLTIEKASNKVRKSTGVLNGQFCKHEIGAKSIPSAPKSAYSDVVSALIERESLDKVAEYVESLLRVSLAFVLSISLSAAVLRNTFAHFLSLSATNEDRSSTSDARAIQAEAKSSQRQHEIVKLMQYQLMKIYDLKRKSEYSILFLQTLAATIRRVYLRSSNHTGGGEGESADDPDFRKAANAVANIELASNESESALSQLFGTEDYVHPQILVRCLLDKNDDTVLISCMSSSPGTVTPAGFNMIVDLRRGLLDHLSAVYQTSEIHNGTVACDTTNCVASCIEMASAVSMLLPKFRKEVEIGWHREEDEVAESDDAERDDVSINDVAALLSSYFRFVKCLLIKANEGYASHINKQGGPEDNEKDCRRDSLRMKDSSALMASFLKCAINMNATKATSNLQDSTPTTMQQARSFDTFHAFRAFLEHLRICEDEATALELIDILSILSSNEAELVASTLEASWRVLHTVYTVPHRSIDESRSGQLPPAFLDAMTRINARCQGPLAKENKMFFVERALSATMMRSATNTSKSFHENAMLRRSLLVMWGLMARPCSITHECDYLSKLVNELVRFLDGVDGTAPSSFEGEDEDGGSQGGTERSKRLQTRSKKKRPYISSIPSLNFSSLDVFFEMALHVAVASFAVSSHTKTGRAKTSETRATQDAENLKSPFHHLHLLIKLIDGLLDEYVSRFCLFPRRMVSVFLGACKHMLNVCLFHIHGCVQWRNAQPLLSIEQKRAGVHDIGAIRYLEELLQVFASCGPSKVMALCQVVRSQSLPSMEAHKDDEEGPEAVEEHFFSSNDKRFTSLMLSAQKCMETLRNVASAHNLVPPQFEDASVEKATERDVQKKRSLRDDADKGYHELDRYKTTQEESSDGADEESTKKRKRRVTPTLVSVQDDVCDLKGGVESELRKRRRPFIDDEEYEWDDEGLSTGSPDDQSEASSEAFGVSGQWGDDDDVDETNSSGSLELEVSDIFQAA